MQYEEFDYVIVGAGSAGCVLASRLSEDPSVSVCLLESGGPDKSVLIHAPAGFVGMVATSYNNWAFDTVPQQHMDNRKRYQPRGKTLGGSSSINAMLYVRGNRWDYDHWASLGNPGWSYEDVLPYFKRAENNETHGASEYHGAGGPLNVAELRTPSELSKAFIDAAVLNGIPTTRDYNGVDQFGSFMYQVTQKNGERCSAAKAYLTPNLSRPNLCVKTHALSAKIIMQGKRACGIAYYQGSEAKEVRARREVILSAGTFGSPQLLLLSGIGPAKDLQAVGIPVVHDLPGVGENLQDHIDHVQSYISASDSQTFGLSLNGAIKMAKGVFEWRKQRTGMITSSIAEAGAFVRSTEVQAPDLQLVFVVALVDDHGRKMHTRHGFSCHVEVLRPTAVARSNWPAPTRECHRRSTPIFLPIHATSSCWSRACSCRWTFCKAARCNRGAARCSIPSSAMTRQALLPISGRGPTPSTTRPVPARWGRPLMRWPWSMRNCVYTGLRGCGWWTPRSCRQ
jgi:choline dehydrogenase